MLIDIFQIFPIVTSKFDFMYKIKLVNQIDN